MRRRLVLAGTIFFGCLLMGCHGRPAVATASRGIDGSWQSRAFAVPTTITLNLEKGTYEFQGAGAPVHRRLKVTDKYANVTKFRMGHSTYVCTLGPKGATMIFTRILPNDKTMDPILFRRVH